MINTQAEKHLYVWTWIGGRKGSAYATSRRDALKQATAQLGKCNLVMDMSTLKKV